MLTYGTESLSGLLTSPVEGRGSEPRQFLPPCRVCGDKAAGFHYGVNTCEACKGFFHRSLRRYKEYKCRANRTSGYCDYKPGKRKSCQYCRYRKCLDAGMSKEAIKTGRYTYLKRTEDTREIKRLQDMTQKYLSDGSCQPSSSLTSSLASSTSSIEDVNDMGLGDLCSHSLIGVDTATKEGYDPLFNEIFNSSQESSSSGASGHFLQLEANGNQKFMEVSSDSPCISFMNPSMLSQSKMACAVGVTRTSTSYALSPTSSKLYTSNAQQFFADISHRTTNHLFGNCESEFKSDPAGHFNKGAKQTLRLPAQATRHCGDTSLSSCPDQDMNSIKPGDRFHNFNTRTHCKTYMKSSYGESDQFIKNNFSSYANGCLDSDQNGAPTSGESGGQCIVTAGHLNDLKPIKQEQLQGDYEVFHTLCYTRPEQSPNTPASSCSKGATPPVLSPSRAVNPVPNPDLMQPCPGATVLNLDSGQRMKVEQCSDLKTEGESKCFREESVAAHIMGEYIQQRADLPRSSPVSQKPSPVQTLLTAASPTTSPRFVTSPLPSPLSDEDYYAGSYVMSFLTGQPQELTVSSVPNLFKNRDGVISTLMESHRENIVDFTSVPKEEMRRQQQAHFEACRLKNKTFGSLDFLPEKEYDEIYSVTGMDVDNRRRMINTYLQRMERCVRGLVQFAKSIPGFSNLDIATQVELIKASRSEFAMFTTYPTVNLELGVSLGLSGLWTCAYDVGRVGTHVAITEYMKFSDALQKLDPTDEEVVLLKAIIVMSTDRDVPLASPIAECIRWELCQCLLYRLQNRCEKPLQQLARYILALTQVRTVSDKFKEFLKTLRLEKYSTIEQNPLLLEMYSSVIHMKDKKDDTTSSSKGAQDEMESEECDEWPAYMFACEVSPHSLG